MSSPSFAGYESHPAAIFLEAEGPKAASLLSIGGLIYGAVNAARSLIDTPEERATLEKIVMIGFDLYIVPKFPGAAMYRGDVLSYIDWVLTIIGGNPPTPAPLPAVIPQGSQP